MAITHEGLIKWREYNRPWDLLGGLGRRLWHVRSDSGRFSEVLGMMVKVALGL